MMDAFTFIINLLLTEVTFFILCSLFVRLVFLR
jgi:hypothetical protein